MLKKKKKGDEGIKGVQNLILPSSAYKLITEIL